MSTPRTKRKRTSSRFTILATSAVNSKKRSENEGHTITKKGLPFRDAHEAVALAVRTCVDKSCDLSDMPLAELQSFSSLIEADVFAVLTLEGSVAARDHIGGTAPNQVRMAIARLREQLTK